MRYIYLIVFTIAMYSANFTVVLSQTTYGSCYPPYKCDYLDINNVKANICAGGFFFTNRSDYQYGYEVPQGSSLHSYFFKTLWFGGKDQFGSLRMAAMFYGLQGDDFWPGPLTIDGSAQIDAATSSEFNEVYKISRSEVDLFRRWYQVYSVNQNNAAIQFPGYSIPEIILNWPAHGDTTKGYSYYLAPFVDKNGDGHYNPFDGDYPAYDFGELHLANGKLWGHQTLWTIYNDKGNVHTESGGLPLGIEIHQQSFAFATNDALNDATFHRLQIINRSTNTYSDFNISSFSHFLLGYEYDNYFGFDVSRGLFYCFNGDSIDAASPANVFYGANPPAIGIKLFKGPLMDQDGVDNAKYDMFIDPVTGDTSYIQRCDESINGQNFGNGIIDDERLGFTNLISFGFGANIWASHPNSPLDFYNYQQSIWTDGTKLNYGGLGHPSEGSYGPDCRFMFPGDSDPCNWGTGGIMPNGPQNWSSFNLFGPGLARGIATTGPITFHPGDTIDIIYGIPWARAISSDPFESVELLRQISDEFEEHFDNEFANVCYDNLLDFHWIANDLSVNYYYFDTALSYSWDFGDGNTSTALNPIHVYDQPGIYQVCLEINTICGVKRFCNEVKVKYERDKLSVLIKRIEGHGNGNLYIEMAQSSIDEIMSGYPWISYEPIYKHAKGPIDVFIPDSSHYTVGEFVVALDCVEDTCGWRMYLVGGTDTVYSDFSIGEKKYQYIPQWGLMIGVCQAELPGSKQHSNGFIYSDLLFQTGTTPWLSGVPDSDLIYEGPQNWIYSGSAFKVNSNAYVDYDSPLFLDPDEHFENIIGGTWSPYRLASRSIDGPAFPNAVAHSLNKLENIYSVDIVLTPDKSKWSRCPVVETGNDPLLAVDNVPKLHVRKAPSVDKDGNPDGTGTGMGWFPGYAINVETGERLNVMFGENSWLAGENGNDMRFNPTSSMYTNLGHVRWGGMHFVYVFSGLNESIESSPTYDEGTWSKQKLDQADNASMRHVYSSIMWVGIPLAVANTQWLQDDAIVRIRVERPYMAGYAKGIFSATPINNNFPMYSLNTSNVNTNISQHFMPDKLKVSVVPNPFIDNCVISYALDPDETSSVFIYDLSGQLVFTYESISSGKVEVNRSHLSTGVYLFRIATTKGRFASGRLVVL